MGFFDLLSSSTPGGIAGQAAKEMAGGIFEGVDKLIRDFKLPPEQQIAYEKFKEETALKLEEIALKRQENDTVDRNSARQREMSVKDHTPAILSYLVVAIYSWAQWFVFNYALPSSQIMLVSRVLGTLDMALGMVLGYYFGSSASSHRKDAILAEAVKK